MTRDDIIRMAEYAGIFTNKTSGELHGYQHSLDRFAALVAEHEREACAKVCQSKVNVAEDWESIYWDGACEVCAAAIRQRGKE